MMIYITHKHTQAHRHQLEFFYFLIRILKIKINIFAIIFFLPFCWFVSNAH